MLKDCAHFALRLAAMLCAPILLSGCLSDSGSKSLGSGHDFGDNNPELVLCMGDSITAGGYSGGDPWPARFSRMTGKAAINAGAPGEPSTGGTVRIGPLLNERRPGFVIIFFGANDAIRDVGIEQTEQAMRSMIAAAKRNQTVPVIATTPPMSGARVIFNERVENINSRIRSIARDEGVKLVDLHRAMRRTPELYLVDGLHLNDLGETVVSLEFADAFR